MYLTREEKKILIKAARAAIESIFDKTEYPSLDLAKYPALKSKCGAFVTLREKKRLRGCIGYILSNSTLLETVCEAAVNAAVGDPRFPPVTESDLDRLNIEISVLSEPFKMESYDDIELGVHGLICTEAGSRGLLLPQVPVEHKMNKEQFLSAICQKTGLSAELWKQKTLNLELFTATVFNESETED